MNKAEQTCVQTLSAERRDSVFRSVNGVSRNGMTEMSHMNSYLMSSARFKPEPEERKIPVFFKHRVMSYCVLGILIGDTHLFAVIGASADGSINYPLRFFQMTVNNGSVFPCEGMLFDLSRKRNVCRIGFRNEQ